jgi:hypothetical protein
VRTSQVRSGKDVGQCGIGSGVSRRRSDAQTGRFGASRSADATALRRSLERICVASSAICTRTRGGSASDLIPAASYASRHLCTPARSTDPAWCTWADGPCRTRPIRTAIPVCGEVKPDGLWLPYSVRFQRQQDIIERLRERHLAWARCGWHTIAWPAGDDQQRAAFRAAPPAARFESQ